MVMARAILLASLIATVEARADFATEKMATLAAEITQVESGGVWSVGTDSGFFRAILALEDVDGTGGEARTRVHLVVQWIAVAESGASTIRQSKPIAEILAKNLGNGAIELFAEAENALTVRIASFSDEGEEASVDLVTLAADGSYAVAPEPKRAPPPPAAAQ